MASTAKTTNYRLNQWAGSDKPVRTDFNADNAIIDSALASIRSSISGFAVLGRYATTEALEAAHPTGQSGDAYAVGSADDYDLYVWDTTAGAWVSIGPVHGAYGDVLGPATSEDGEIMLFDGITGKAAKGSGMTFSELTAALSDLQDAVSAIENDINDIEAALAALDALMPVGAVVGTSDTQTLENKTLEAPVIRGWDWWAACNETWTYVSATSFTVSGDKTSKYKKGDKIKWTQNGTVRYSNILSVTYSAGTGLSTITIHAGYVTTAGDCSILATSGSPSYPITANYYSKGENPQGFPAFFNFVLAVTAATGTYTAVSGSCKFSMSGAYVRISSLITITTNNTAAGGTYTDLPITCEAATHLMFGREDVAAGFGLQARINGAQCRVYKLDNTYPGSNGYQFILDGFYIAA